MKIIVTSVYTGMTKEEVGKWVKELAENNPDFAPGKEDLLNGESVHLKTKINQHIDVITSFLIQPE